LLRFAPSPTGDMHIGNLRVALFNYIVSKQKNENLIIRIEDTDKKRNIEGKDKEILELLNLFSIEYSQVIHQSNNLKYHSKFAMQLLIEKKAFNCFCGEDILEKEKDEAKQNKKPYRYSGFCENLSDEVSISCEAPFTVRLKKPTQNIEFKDMIKGDFEYKPFDIDSFVILRHDKTATYNFACAIDDMLSDITTVIRGEDHLSNTPKQIHIRNSIGYDKQINYVHLPVILNKDTGKKMSKRDEASGVRWLIDEGFLPIAIANYLVLLGYNPPKEIFTIEEAIQWFDISKVSKSPAKFDIDKLNFINKAHIQDMDNLRLSKILGYSDEDIGALGKVYLEECYTIKQIKEKIDAIFRTKTTLTDFEEQFETLKACVIDAPYIEDFNQFKKYITENTQLKGKNLFMPLRYALTNTTNGPNLSDIYPLIRNYLGEIIK
jgi:glutamyl-tRNA synthetase